MIKKKLLKSCLLTLSTIIFFSCDNSNDDLNNEFELYTGNYKIISFKSNIAVDLNNDNSTSKELINEIDSFDFNDLEIRPNEYQTNSAKLISFSFPKTWMTFEYPSAPEGSVEFVGYGFLTTYEYVNSSFSLKNNNYIEKSFIDNVESHKKVNINSVINVIDENHLKTSIYKEYYDFNSSNWIMLDIEVVYEKRV